MSDLSVVGVAEDVVGAGRDVAVLLDQRVGDLGAVLVECLDRAARVVRSKRAALAVVDGGAAEDARVDGGGEAEAEEHGAGREEQTHRR